ncbi:MAG: hypothetical protein AAB152_04745 [Candidatus Coatesbacteria bacterium]
MRPAARPSLILLLCTASLTASAAEAPTGLTGWRSARGITLSWSQSPAGGFTIWRGTVSGSLRTLASLPPGQGGFWDTSAARLQGYVYALGDSRSHGPELVLAGAPPPVRIMAGQVTTCSGLRRDAVYPADTQAFFTPSRDAFVEYFGYFLMRPFDPTVREARIVWRDPKGGVFAEYSHPITPRRVELPEGPVGQIVLPLSIGLRQVVAQNGQTRVPTEPGTYTVEAFVDDVPVSLTVWYLREEASKKAAPPTGASAPGGALEPSLPGTMPRTPLPGTALP